MGSATLSLQRQRILPNIGFAPHNPNRIVLFHEVEMNHTGTTWDVTAQVFWKGLLREYNGEMYLRLVLRDEERTKMEAVAFGSHY
ncbi:hypothetical protein BS78_01G153200 [Paspalum vaginatum]|nr:hypothetical protein BS78_01G153200 [Paspalum vaginatum]